MEPIKILLILGLIILTVLIIYNQSSSCQTVNKSEKEGYYASFDQNIIDPRVHPYSKNITYRPDSDDDSNETTQAYGKTVTAGLANTDVSNVFENQINAPLNTNVPDHANNDSTKMLTHISDQDIGVNDYDNVADTDPYNNLIRNRPKIHDDITYSDQLLSVSPDISGNINQNTKTGSAKRLVDQVTLLRGTRETMTNIPRTGSNFMSDIDRDLKIVGSRDRRSSYYNTDINGYVIRETNNIAGSCSNVNVYGQSLLDTADNVPLMDSEQIDFPYSDRIDEVESPNMADEQYMNNLKNMQKLKIFVKDTAKCKIDEMEECERRLEYEDMNDVLNRYRMNSHNAIRGSYKNSSCTVAVRNGMQMYDIVD